MFCLSFKILGIFNSFKIQKLLVILVLACTLCLSVFSVPVLAQSTPSYTQQEIDCLKALTERVYKFMNIIPVECLNPSGGFMPMSILLAYPGILASYVLGIFAYLALWFFMIKLIFAGYIWMIPYIIPKDIRVSRRRKKKEYLRWRDPMDMARNAVVGMIIISSAFAIINEVLILLGLNPELVFKN